MEKELLGELESYLTEHSLTRVRNKVPRPGRCSQMTPTTGTGLSKM